MTAFMVKRRHVIMGLAATTALPRMGLAQSAPKRGGTLRISHSNRIATLNVMTNSGVGEYPVMDMVYSGLTRIGLNNTVLNDLAESWEANDDATEFVFHLRPGVTFHDGTPLTSADVVATFKAILNPDVPASAKATLGMVESVEAVDDLTVKFTLKAPYADLPTATAHANARILSVAAVTGDLAELDTKVNGTGPFMLETYDSARIVRLVRNPNYHDPEKPYLDAVEMHLFPDLAAETANFLSGDVDIMLTVQQADYQRIAESAGVEALRVPSGRYVNVVMRQDQPPFDDVRVRRAMAMSVDRQLLVDIVLEGLGRPAYDNILSPEFKYAIDTPEIAYDPEGAKALLAEAGYPDGLDLTMVASNRPAIRGQVAIAIKQMAEPAGFRIDVESMPHDTYLANVWMQGNFYIGYWGMQSTEDETFNLLLTSNAAYQDTEWKNAEFDAAVAAGRSTVNEDQRAAAYRTAQELMLRDVPYVIPFFEDALTASREDVEAWTINPINRYFYIENVWLDRS
jgi:peptide/nickel transport system substrate-binding protein